MQFLLFFISSFLSSPLTLCGSFHRYFSQFARQRGGCLNAYNYRFFVVLCCVTVCVLLRITWKITRYYLFYKEFSITKIYDCHRCWPQNDRYCYLYGQYMRFQFIVGVFLCCFVCMKTATTTKTFAIGALNKLSVCCSVWSKGCF